MFSTPLTTSQLNEAYETYEEPLLRYVKDRLVQVDWRHGEQLARAAWVKALGTLRLSPVDVGMEEGLPAWLASAARYVIRQHSSAAVLAADRFFTVTRTKAAEQGLVLVEAPAAVAAEVSASRTTLSSVPLAA